MGGGLGASGLGLFGLGAPESYNITLGAQTISTQESWRTPALASDATSVVASRIDTHETWGLVTAVPQGRPMFPGHTASGESWFSALLAPTTTLGPSTIASGVAFGTTSMHPGGAVVLPAWWADPESWGSAIASPEERFLSPPATSSGEAWSTLSLLPVSWVLAFPTSSGELVPPPAIAPGWMPLSPDATPTQESWAIPYVSPQESVLDISPTPTNEVWRTVGVSPTSTLSLTPIPTSLVWYAPDLAPGEIRLAAEHLTSTESFGVGIVLPEERLLYPDMTASDEMWGLAAFYGHAWALPGLIPTSESVSTPDALPGYASVSAGQTPPSETWGLPYFNPLVQVAPEAIFRLETWGVSSMAPRVTIGATPMGPTEVWGVTLLHPTVTLGPSWTSGAEAWSPTEVRSTVYLGAGKVETHEGWGNPLFTTWAAIINPVVLSSETWWGTTIHPVITLHPVSTTGMEGWGTLTLHPLILVHPGPTETAETWFGTALSGHTSVVGTPISTAEMWGEAETKPQVSLFPIGAPTTEGWGYPALPTQVTLSVPFTPSFESWGTSRIAYVIQLLMSALARGHGHLTQEAVYISGTSLSLSVVQGDTVLTYLLRVSTHGHGDLSWFGPLPAYGQSSLTAVLLRESVRRHHTGHQSRPAPKWASTDTGVGADTSPAPTPLNIPVGVEVTVGRSLVEGNLVLVHTGSQTHPGPTPRRAQRVWATLDGPWTPPTPAPTPQTPPPAGAAAAHGRSLFTGNMVTHRVPSRRGRA